MARPGEVISHWHHFVEDFSTSTLDFYKGIEETLTAKDAPVRPQRIDWAESGVFSAKREYLRATYGPMIGLSWSHIGASASRTGVGRSLTPGRPRSNAAYS